MEVKRSGLSIKAALIALKIAIINALIQGSNMATYADVVAAVTSIGDKINFVDAKLDAIRDLINSLKVDVPVTQEQLDSLAAALADVEAHAGEVQAEADSIS